jgi:valyl-tRNA synthetase
VGKDCEEEYIVARSSDEALEKARAKYGKDVEIYQDPDVLDTWFSRSISQRLLRIHIFFLCIHCIL